MLPLKKSIQFEGKIWRYHTPRRRWQTAFNSCIVLIRNSEKNGSKKIAKLCGYIFSELFPVSKCKWRKCRSSAFHCSTGKFHQNRFTGSEDRRCNILHRYNGPVTAVERWKMYESFGNQLQTARVEGVIVGRGAKNRVRRTNLKVLENLSTDLIKVSSKSNPRTICATKKKTVKNSNISQIAPLPATSSQRSVWNYKFSGLVFTFLRLVTAKWDHWPTDKAKGTEAYPLLFYIGKSLETFLWKPWTGPVGYVSILCETLTSTIGMLS